MHQGKSTTSELALMMHPLYVTIDEISIILSTYRGSSASLNMNLSSRIRRRNFVNSTSKDTAVKEINAFTCTISFTDDHHF